MTLNPYCLAGKTLNINVYLRILVPIQSKHGHDGHTRWKTARVGMSAKGCSLFTSRRIGRHHTLERLVLPPIIQRAWKGARAQSLKKAMRSLRSKSWARRPRWLALSSVVSSQVSPAVSSLQHPGFSQALPGLSLLTPGP